MSGSQVSVIVHTTLAKDVLEDFSWRHVNVLPHPICVAPNSPDICASSSAAGTGEVLICGQWKPARDMSLISALGQGLSRLGLTPVIAGRGWPAVPGWTVAEGFMSEEEMTDRLRRALCLLVPYSRYFQSNVAVRALENGTPVVGERHPFLEGLLGSEYAGYVDGVSEPETWVRAVERAIGVSPESLGAHLAIYERQAVESWSAFVSRRQSD